MTPLLAVDNLHAAYLQKEILQGVSLAVHQGEIVALLGSNGSGKSTVLKTIAGLLRPTRGRILFRGQVINALSIYARQHLGLGFLLQGGRVFPNLSVAENLELAARHRRNPQGGHSVQAGSVFGVLKEKARVRAGLLSGGQRQMLAVEILLAQAPDLALLDEPTAALSRDGVEQVLTVLKDFVGRNGCGVLLVEQNVYEARRITSRQLTLVDGALVPENLQEASDGATH
jgi:branched-chain amino acid transport system ATP-binding protein